MKPYRNFLMWTGAMVALAIMSAGWVDASRLGVVNFANGSTHPIKIPAGLVAQAQAAARKPGHVVVLRGGASPIGSPSYNFVLSGERVAANRDDLVGAGIPRAKIVSQFVGVVHRGTAAADRAVILDATTREALGMAPAHIGQSAALTRLEAQVAGLEAAAHKAATKAVPAKAKARPFYSGRVWYATRTTQENSTSVSDLWYPNSGGTYTPATAGDNYQSTGYGFSIRTRRPVDFNFWTPYTVPLRFSLVGLSQA